MSTDARAPLGLYGGAFDPVHHGHLRLALECRERLALAEVRLLPTGRAPHREAARASGSQRLAMLQLAVDQEAGLAADARELERQRPSYTVDTLLDIRAEQGMARSLIWILGLDAFLGLPTWHRWDELLHLCHLVVIHRPGYHFDPGISPQLAELTRGHQTDDPQQLHAVPSGRLLFLPLPLLEISSTAIRARVRTGHSIRYLVPDAVQAFINTHSLYRQENHGYYTSPESGR